MDTHVHPIVHGSSSASLYGYGEVSGLYELTEGGEEEPAGSAISEQPRRAAIFRYAVFYWLAASGSCLRFFSCMARP